MATTAVPEVRERENKAVGYTLTTTAEPVNESIDRTMIGQLLLESIDWDKAESRTSERSGDVYKTTRSISWNMTDAEESRYQITISVNRWPKKQVREGVTGKGGKEPLMKISPVEVAFLEQQAEVAQAEGNNSLAMKLMTIKVTNKLQGGINLEQGKFLLQLIENAGAKQAEKDAVVS